MSDLKCHCMPGLPCECLSELTPIFSVLGGLLFGVWMVATNAAWGLHGEEVFSSQRIADFKCFLRMRFEADRLTIYPLKIDKVCTRWKVGPGIKTQRRVAGAGACVPSLAVARASSRGR